MPVDRKRVVTSVDEEGVIGLLRKLVQIPSLSEEEKEISEFIAATMEKSGLSVEVIGGNVVGRRMASVAGPTLILNGHMDTVPAGDRTAWTYDPFGAEMRRGRIYGRGTSDMKGGLAAMIMAVDALDKAEVELKGDVIVTAVIMEELGKRLRKRKGIVELIDKGIIRGDAAVVGEATNLKVSLGHRSRAVFEVVTHGMSAHASMPEKGVNAIEKMMKVIRALTKLRMGDHDFLGRGTVNIGTIEGGTKANVVPDRCKILIDRRLTVGETPEKAGEDIRAKIQELMEEDEDLKVDVRCPYGWYPTLISEKEPIVKTVVDAVESITKRKPTLINSSFHTDGGLIHHMTGIPVVIFGPGREEHAHIADEYIEVNQLVEATKIYALTIAGFLDR